MAEVVKFYCDNSDGNREKLPFYKNLINKKTGYLIFDIRITFTQLKKKIYYNINYLIFCLKLSYLN